MKINFIFKDYESEIYKNDQEVERSSAFWWWFDLIEFLMILFRGLLFEIIVNWVFWVFWEPRIESRTTDAQRENSLHCTAENSIPIPNFMVRPKHILSATSADFSDIFDLCLHWVSIVRDFRGWGTLSSIINVGLKKSEIYY